MSSGRSRQGGGAGMKVVFFLPLLVVGLLLSASLFRAVARDLAFFTWPKADCSIIWSGIEENPGGSVEDGLPVQGRLPVQRGRLELFGRPVRAGLQGLLPQRGPGSPVPVPCRGSGSLLLQPGRSFLRSARAVQSLHPPALGAGRPGSRRGGRPGAFAPGLSRRRERRMHGPLPALRPALRPDRLYPDIGVRSP